jgi:carboxymethylenebutenolidase
MPNDSLVRQPCSFAVVTPSFLVTSLGAGFALAVQPVMAQTAIKTDEVGLLAGEIKVPVKDGEMVA